jgi:hypothetical protein
MDWLAGPVRVRCMMNKVALVQGFLRVQFSPVRIFPSLLLTHLSHSKSLITINVLCLGTLKWQRCFGSAGNMHSECLHSLEVEVLMLLQCMSVHYVKMFILFTSYKANHLASEITALCVFACESTDSHATWCLRHAVTAYRNITNGNTRELR